MKAKVKIKKTKEIGEIQAVTLPLKDYVNYCVLFTEKSGYFTKFYYGKDLELL